MGARIREAQGHASGAAAASQKHADERLRAARTVAAVVDQGIEAKRALVALATGGSRLMDQAEVREERLENEVGPATFVTWVPHTHTHTHTHTHK